MDDVRELIREKIIFLKKEKGVSYQWIADKAGVTRFDVAHLASDNRKLGKNKLIKLKEFILNY
ncbi:hypothetical protein [Clostridium sp. JN-1]|uniref:hypothetical protein n=1 Tax=Clostridium sp. JN-1 TaxID=2483110 RepID=UPI000F0B39EE|nr:hypothetical protein [Clostridium sp. JN-1]